MAYVDGDHQLPVHLRDGEIVAYGEDADQLLDDAPSQPTEGAERAPARDHSSTGAGTSDPTGSTKRPKLTRDRDDRWASDAYLALLRTLAWRMDHRHRVDDVDVVEACGDAWQLLACPNGHDEGRDKIPMTCGWAKICPYCASRRAYEDRAGPIKDALFALSDAGRNLGVAKMELTIPPEGWAKIGFHESTAYRKLVVQLVEDLWERKRHPGKPALNVQVHLTSSSNPHVQKPHLHVLVPGIGRWDPLPPDRYELDVEIPVHGASDLDLGPDRRQRPPVPIEDPDAPTVDDLEAANAVTAEIDDDLEAITVGHGVESSSRVDLGEDVRATVASEGVRIHDDTLRRVMAESGDLYDELQRPTGKKPSGLKLEREDLDWLRQRWGELVANHHEYVDQITDDVWTCSPIDATDPRRGEDSSWGRTEPYHHQEPVQIAEPFEFDSTAWRRAYKGMVVNYDYRHWHTPEFRGGEKVELDDGQHMKGRHKIRHWANYHARAYLDDVNRAVHAVEDDVVVLQDGQDTRMEPLTHVLEGVEWRIFGQPSHWHQGAWYSWMSDAIRQRTADELGIEFETLEERKERLQEESCTCPVCDEDLEIVGYGDREAAEAWVDDGEWLLDEYDRPPPGHSPTDSVTDDRDQLQPRGRHHDGAASWSSTRSPSQRREAELVDDEIPVTLTRARRAHPLDHLDEINEADY